MFRSRFNWTILLFAAFLLGVAWIGYSQEDSSESETPDGEPAPIAGYRAPDFSLETTLGQQVSLGDFRGQPVVLNFWATWCPPCRAEIPHFQDASMKYHGSAAILGIDQGEPLPVVADFGAAFGVTYPLLLDTDSAVNRAYNVSALPTTVFIDAQGTVQEVFTGIVNQAVLEDRIENMLSGG